jgi:hypothetical protein
MDYDLRAMPVRIAASNFTPHGCAVVDGDDSALGTLTAVHVRNEPDFRFPRVCNLSIKAYAERLFQQPYTIDMVEFGHAGGHFGWTQHALVAKLVAPLLNPPNCGGVL